MQFWKRTPSKFRKDRERIIQVPDLLALLRECGAQFKVDGPTVKLFGGGLLAATFSPASAWEYFGEDNAKFRRWVNE